MIRLDNWAVVCGGDPYTAPELQTNHLIGTVSGHPEHADGKEVRTSRIVGIEGEDVVVTSSGSRYQLGEVDPTYEAMFSNAKERVIASIKKF
jgi:hypothetical protein